MENDNAQFTKHSRLTWTAPKAVIFSPRLILAISLAAALAFAGLILLLFTGGARTFLLYYFVPIAVPFVAYLFDRAKDWDELSRAQVKIDAPVVILAILRSGMPIPLISGHALFLSYVLLTTRSGLARITALLVLVEVVYIKIFLWQDITLVGGLVLGLGAAIWFKRVKKESAGSSGQS